MGSSVPRREERGAAVLRLQRLLSSAEASFSSGAAGSGEAALERLFEAFELLRAQFQSDLDVSRSVHEGERRRWALVAIARVLLEMDRAVAEGDQESIARALGYAKTALAASSHIDESSPASGVRRRPIPDE